MPNMNGFELLSGIRTRFPELPAIAIRGEFVSVHESPLADAFFQKGHYEVPNFLTTVSDLLSSSRKDRRKAQANPIWAPTGDAPIMLTCAKCLHSFPLIHPTSHINRSKRIAFFAEHSWKSICLQSALPNPRVRSSTISPLIAPLRKSTVGDPRKIDEKQGKNVITRAGLHLLQAQFELPTLPQSSNIVATAESVL